MVGVAGRIHAILLERWPSEYIKVACNGLEVFVAGELPRNTAGTRLEEDERLRAVVLKKLTKVVVQRYVMV
jgi:hypothetical protein